MGQQPAKSAPKDLSLSTYAQSTCNRCMIARDVKIANDTQLNVVPKSLSACTEIRRSSVRRSHLH